MAKEYGLGNAGEGFDDGTQQQQAVQSPQQFGRPQQLPIYGAAPILAGSGQRPKKTNAQAQQDRNTQMLEALLMQRRGKGAAPPANQQALTREQHAEAMADAFWGRGRPGSRLQDPTFYMDSKAQRAAEKEERIARLREKTLQQQERARIRRHKTPLDASVYDDYFVA